MKNTKEEAEMSKYVKENMIVKNKIKTSKREKYEIDLFY